MSDRADAVTHHDTPFENLKPSILIIILILSITVLVSLLLCLLLRLLNRRCIGRLSPSSATTTTITASSTAAASNHHHHTASHRVSPEAPELSILDSLPLFPYASIKRRSSSVASGDCAVCLSRFEPQDLLRLLPLCCHAFHAQCIDTWLVSNQTCPLCRSSIVATDSDIMKSFSARSSGSFRLEIGSISRRQPPAPDSSSPTERQGSYSFGSFEYVVDEETEVAVNQTHRRSVSDKEAGAQLAQEPSLAADVAGGRSWLRDYVDRFSQSFSSSRAFSGRFFGSCRRSGDFDPEAIRAGEEISEMFSWLSEY
ncbi:hypothetical protein Tsubulata_002763 [Turnera subulata]|uniref:RING-type E3 ubiquitin transferase n=1 Tax=Turnera subulata TaxID=218843 RepID=A0A9Q0JP26_9ROSI|nr:hypothetical protein Tsubulata_002763 [Turnera subulata]